MNKISDAETHFFKSVKILEDQLKKKSKEAHYYKTLYNENKNKLDESESVKNILKNVINIQKNACLHSPKNTSKVSSQIFLPSVSVQSQAEKIPETHVEEQSKFYVYKQSQPPSKSSTSVELNLLKKTIDTNQTVLNSIKQLLKSKSSDVQLYNSRDIDNVGGENISSYVELIIEEYCKLKNSTSSSESVTMPDSDSLSLKDLCCDLFEKFNDKIVQVLSLLNDSNSFTSVLNDHKDLIDSLICRIEISKISPENKKLLSSSIVKIKRDFIHSCSLISTDSVKSITDIKNEFNQYLYTALTHSDAKILQGIFLTQSDETSASASNSIDIPIRYDGLIEAQPLQLQSICFKETIDILNTFFSALIHKAHNRYTKAIRIWADQSSQNHQEFSDIQHKYFLLISSISKVVNERETFPMQTDDESVADLGAFFICVNLENKIIKLSEIKKLNEGLNIKLEEKQLQLSQLEQKLKKDNRTSVLCKKFDEFLNEFSDENYDDDTKESIYSIIVSFDTLLDKFLRNRSDFTVEIAENLEKICNNYIDNIGKCSQSFSRKLNELKTMIDSYKISKIKHTTELSNLNQLLDESNSKIVRLEEELEKMESTNSLKYEMFDSTTKIADIYDSVLRYSTDIIQKGSELMKTRNEIMKKEEHCDNSIKNNSSCSSDESISFDEDIFKYLDSVDALSEEAHVEEVPTVVEESVISNSDKEQKSENTKVSKTSIDASLKLNQLEQAVQQLYTVNQELLNSQKLYENNDRETNSTSNLLDENTQPSIPAEKDAAQLSFTAGGPILHL
ncbi:hypothetical protein MXB_3204 [Myxobolus squamalis]|nr:hypothetical protein MXB_3204 [Myxobolus squamalis]